MNICVMLCCVMPLRYSSLRYGYLRYSCLRYGYLRYVSFRDGHLQNRLVAIQLWIDAFMIWTILFQILIIEFCHTYIPPYSISHTSIVDQGSTVDRLFAVFKLTAGATV